VGLRYGFAFLKSSSKSISSTSTNFDCLLD